MLSTIALLSVLIDWYIYRRLKRLGHPRAARVQKYSAFVLWGVFLVVALLPKTDASDSALVTLMWVIYGYLSIYVPKLVACLFSLLSLLPRLWHGKPWRRLMPVGCLGALGVFGVMWWGALWNRTEIQVREATVDSQRVPAAFNGYRIVQISDLHTGTYGGDTTHLQRMVQTVNGLKPDLIVFTGDIVNRHSQELLPQMSVLGRLHAPDGVWSVLGNHDYGHYYAYTDAECAADTRRLMKLQEQMGWHMLDNAHHAVVHGTDTLMLIGVGNIGDPPFKTYGDVLRAYPTPGDSTFKVLLSHNPRHWVMDIKDRADKLVDLTLSGHTHAMQAEVAGKSLSVLRYPEWGGMYTDGKGQCLYVNIGFGTVGFPARIGATPEITLITLRHENHPK